MAQLAEQSLLTPEIRGSNPNIGKNSSVNCIISKDENKEKEAGIRPLKKRKVQQQKEAKMSELSN